MSIPTFNPAWTSIPNGTPKDFYNLYKDTTINPTSYTQIGETEPGTDVNNNSKYNNPVGKDIAVATTYGYQEDLKRKVAERESINKDVNDQLNYTIMSMAFWVPLGIFAGYYIYNRGSSST